MYNRYIPQPDGSYRRNRMQESLRQPAPSIPQPTVSGEPEPHYGADDPSARTNGDGYCQTRSRPSPPASAGSFLRQLLPGNIDTEDLLVIVLLLLMAGDCEKERGSALLTLALYLFL